jgi:AcrR family transcriptional regulator
VSRAGRPTQTTPEAWAAGALDEIEEAGVAGLSVQAVARRLGVSKGGAYHHFADRRELLRAALALWEQRHVDELTVRFGAIADPRERLTRLMHYAILEIEPTVVTQLLAAAEDPDVAATLERSAAKRLALLERAFRELGLSPARARDRATLTYAAYLGHAQLRGHVPGRLGGTARAQAYLRELLATLLP